MPLIGAVLLKKMQEVQSVSRVLFRRSSIYAHCRQYAQAMLRERDGQSPVFPKSCAGWGLHDGRVARPPVRSYRTFPPLPLRESGGISLLHLPWSRLHQPLTGILPCGARTFLMTRLLTPRGRPTALPAFLRYHIFLCASTLTESFYAADICF